MLSRFTLHISLIVSLFAFNDTICQTVLEGGEKYEIQSLCDEKISILKRYISSIANKDLDRDVRTRKILNVLNHFDEDSYIEISSVNHGKITKHRAADYFRRLRDLSYSQVQVTWERDPKSRPTKVIKINDSTYEVIGRYIQRFQGYNIAGQKIYSDVTVKRVKIELQNVLRADGESYKQILITGIGIESTYQENNFDDLIQK